MLQSREKPISNLVSPLLTDFYQITMAYGYWESGKHNDNAVFDLYFRKNPFGGEFTIFCGLEEVLKFLGSFEFTRDDINYLQTVLPPHADPLFFEWLRILNCKDIKVYALKEGTVTFPNIPLLRVEGPLAVCQLLETTLLNLVNYSSLVATNAARIRLAAGPEKILLEFGLRRAQGPDGAVSASRYSYIGGFDKTSNVKAGQLFGIELAGTHSHAFVASFTGLKELKQRTLKDVRGNEYDLVDLVMDYKSKVNFGSIPNEGELAAFIAYAIAFPNSFLALVDTYNTLKSGIPNFVLVSLSLFHLGYTPIGIRLDSGDLAYLSKEARKIFRQISVQFNLPPFERLKIVASSDLNEATIYSLNQQKHEIDIFGIGTHLVTCQSQPALGCVYKLVQINNLPRLKLSEGVSKVTIPGRKEAFRLIGQNGKAILDLLVEVGKPSPEAGKSVLCRHPFDESKRAIVTPTKVEPLHRLVWDGKRVETLPTLKEVRAYTRDQLLILREDHLRNLNPTPYKVSVSSDLYDMFHALWLQEAPIEQIF
jgi:nicotinate phosphoribosyltransferase